MDLLAIILPIFTAKNECPNHQKEYQIPVDRILDIPVHMKIRYVDFYKDKEPYCLEIELLSHFVGHEDCPTNKLLHSRYYKSLKLALKAVDVILENPMWSPFCSTFVLEEEHTKTQCSAFFEKYKSSEKITLPFGECCVCNDVVQTKTDCGHRLCVRCHVKIEEAAEKLMTDEQKHGDEEFTIKCPMCRQNYRLDN